jgi:transcriptional regulator with XRE-family HTH domain
MLRAISDRIDQRLQALGLNAREASRKAGLHADAIRNIRRAVENEASGRVGVSTRTIAALAAVLGTTTDWLLEGGADTSRGETPFVAWDKVGRYVDPLQLVGEGDQHLGTQYGRWPEGCFATRTPDDAMNRVSPSGSCIIVDRHDRILLEGCCYLGLLEGRVLFRKWAAEPDRAEPFSNDPAFKVEFLSPNRRWEIIGRVRRTVLDL